VIINYFVNFKVEIVSDNPWHARINVLALDDEARRFTLLRVKNKLSFTKALEALGIARGSLHNYLGGARQVPGEIVERALKYLDEREFYEIVQCVDRLKAIRIIREDERINYSIVPYTRPRTLLRCLGVWGFVS